MAKLGPIKRVNLSDEIANRILDLIRDGSFKPNEKLMSERSFCECFQASRTSVREAIKGLTSMGVVVKRQNGTYVCGSLTDILVKPYYLLFNTNTLELDDLFEARVAIESQIARMAATKVSEEDLMALEDCVISMEHGKDAGEVMEHSVNFHNLLAKSTHNQIMQDMYKVIYGILQRMRDNEKSLRQVHKSQTSHRDILRAIKARDAIRSEREMARHLSDLFTSIK